MNIARPGTMVAVASLVIGLTLLSGCFGRQDGAANLASSAPPSDRAVRQTAHAKPGLRLEAEPGETVASSAGVPRPDQIFDFHPKGPRSEAWRSPFIVDANDGPLAKEVRQTAEELKEYKQAEANPPQPPGSAPAKQTKRTVPCGAANPEEPPCARVQADGSAQGR